jgi:predicted transcriptional regulator
MAVMATTSQNRAGFRGRRTKWIPPEDEEMNKIEAHRRRFAVTQTELAIELGLTQSYISQVERGRLKISRERERELLDAIQRAGERKRALVESVTAAVTQRFDGSVAKED